MKISYSFLFFLSLRPMTLVSVLFLPCSEVCPPRVSTWFSFWSINSSQYHVIVNHVTVFSVSSERAKLNCVTLSVKFEYWYHKKLSMICNKVVWDKHYYSNRLNVRNIFLYCYSRFSLTLSSTVILSANFGGSKAKRISSRRARK